MNTTRSLKRASAEDRGLSPPPLKRKQQSTTTSKAVANFFKPVSQKEPEDITWRIVHESLLIGRYQPNENSSSTEPAPKRRKIAVFDFDSTLVTPASGNVFSRDANDWKWWHGTVPTTLKRLHEDGYLVAVMSNQGGISLSSGSKSLKADQKRLSGFKGRVSAVLTKLDIPISVYAATGKDQYRKPRVGMWTELLEDYDLDGINSIDLLNSFFVGDAGGRSRAHKSANDHSCCDRDFAANIGIDFKTPEEFFLKEEPRPFTRVLEPTEYLPGSSGGPPDNGRFTKMNSLDIVLLCGSPGSGKSSFYWRYLEPVGYRRVNQDLLKSRDKCLKVASDLLKNGESVAVDNTNADAETREFWIKLATQFNVPIRCILFTASAKLCEHNDTVRALSGTTLNPEGRTMLPKLAFTGFASRYREPDLKEGFQDITKIDFKFEGTEEQKAIWAKYWI
ncbi:putative DNA 3'-phosphatase Tpp1 [Patellaria atrata CBS 101060]|uniref:DNA 3'-phosphatase Tpp1 n=1 Tax=Patellaria atrata CBS 101060 TaxID=1346257 RepID=A0A9P4SEA5_9PEZI|nr:putative DNA 3'-phosphatase Tpp1 [Patellaria atrata CBS 101060]